MKRRTRSAHAGKVLRKSPIDKAVPQRRGGVSRAPAERRYLESAELIRFFKQIDHTSFWYSYFYIQYIYGCRLSEPALIKDEDVSFKKKTITIKRLKKMREEGGYIEIPYLMDERVLACVLTAQKSKVHRGLLAMKRVGTDAARTSEENPYLFASSRHRTSEEVGAERLSALRNSDGHQSVSRFTTNRIFRGFAKAAKIPEKLQHSIVIKNTRAVMMLALGSEPGTVCFALGHTSLKMTQSFADAARIVRAKMTDDERSELTSMGLASRGLG